MSGAGRRRADTVATCLRHYCAHNDALHGEVQRLSGRLVPRSMPLTHLGVAVVRGRSMTPTLHDGDRLLVRYAASPRPGAIAIVRFADGVVAVKRLDHRSSDGWWVVRDNAFEGRDSWSAGAIAEDDVLALVVARLWPHPGRLPAAPTTR